jgi:hypothetical protein
MWVSYSPAPVRGSSLAPVIRPPARLGAHRRKTKRANGLQPPVLIGFFRKSHIPAAICPA